MSGAPLTDLFVPVRVAWPRLARAAGWSAVGAFALVPIVASFPEALGAGAGWSTFLVSLALVVVTLALRRGRARHAQLEVDAEGFHFHGDVERLVRRADVASAMVVPGFAPTVDLALVSGGLLRVGVDAVEDGELLLDAAHLSPAARRSVHVVATLRSWIIPLVLLSALLLVVAGLFTAVAGYLFGSAAGVPVFTLTLLGGAALGSVLLAPPTLVVGADGVSVERLGRRQFMAFSDLAFVEQRHGGLRLLRRDGAVLWVNGVELDKAALGAAAHRVDEARRAFSSSGGVTASSLLERRGRTASAWREQLGGLLGGTAGYRTGGLTVDDAAQVLENPSADVEHRIGAALALGAAPDPTTRQRVAEVAEACASVELRVALELAAAGELDDETLEIALRQERQARD